MTQHSETDVVQGFYLTSYLHLPLNPALHAEGFPTVSPRKISPITKFCHISSFLFANMSMTKMCVSSLIYGNNSSVNVIVISNLYARDTNFNFFLLNLIIRFFYFSVIPSSPSSPLFLLSPLSVRN